MNSGGVPAWVTEFTDASASLMHKPLDDLDQMWHVRSYGGRNQYAIFGDCRLRGVGVVRGVILPFPIDLRYRPYNTGHTIV